jgi:NADPH:quinone reductase-like Zn-dependent oxidoreductase
MKAIRFHSFGGPDVLQFEETPEPVLGASEVLVNLKAAALNHLDVFVRRGEREKNIPLPHIPGSDGAGIVAAVGREVALVKPGDRVLLCPGISCGLCDHCRSGRENLCASYHVLGTKEDGTYAEFVKLPSANVIPIPDGMGFREAAAVPLVFMTAWHMLVSLAELRPGQIALIHGARSGVGSAGIQVAKMLGARVITTLGRDDAMKMARDLGADEIIQYQSQDFVQEIRRLTEKKGVDVVFEHVGGEVFSKSITVLRKGGRLVTCGATTEYVSNADLRYLYSRHLTIYGSIMGTRNELVEVLKYFKTHELRAVIDTVFPLSEAAEAHRRMETREHFGKIILDIA